jgi:hypothetical protein
VARATTVRFSDEIYARLDQASARTGMPVNSIVVAACLEWMQRHTPDPVAPPQVGLQLLAPAAPRWATLRRALGQITGPGAGSVYPFKNFTMPARELLVLAQAEAEKRGHSYIGTEHLLLACFGDRRFRSATVLERLGVQRQAVEDKLDAMLDLTKVKSRDRIIPTSRVKKVIEIAFREASRTESLVGTQHLLLALSKEGNGIAAHVLNDLGAPSPKIEQEVASLEDPES